MILCIRLAGYRHDVFISVVQDARKSGYASDRFEFGQGLTVGKMF